MWWLIGALVALVAVIGAFILGWRVGEEYARDTAWAQGRAVGDGEGWSRGYAQGIREQRVRRHNRDLRHGEDA